MSSEVRRTRKRPNKAPSKQLVDEVDESIHADEDEAGVSEAGLRKIMQLLGEDGLNEADVAALEELRQSRGDEDEEETEEDEEESEEEEGDEEDEEESEEEEGDEEDEEESEEEEGEEEEEEPDNKDRAFDNKAKSKAITNSSALSAPKDSLAASILRSGLVPLQDESEEEDQEEDQDTEEDEQEKENHAEIALDDLPETVSISEEARASKHNRVRIQNDGALSRVYEDFRLDKASGSKGGMPWIETMSVTYPKVLADEVPDVQNDLERELAFYRQALDGAVRGRSLVLAANVPFSRPNDYFAEMVKTDEHMERIRQRLLDESASIQASEKAKRQRELKKYGKQVQTEKLLERQKNKREMEDKVSSLKRKRGGLDLDDDEFDVQLEEALDQRKEARKNQRATQGRPKMSRTKRDDKYGFGGKKKYNKSNDAQSLDQFDRRGKGGPGGGKGGPKSIKTAPRKAQRPGKSRRAKGRH